MWRIQLWSDFGQNFTCLPFNKDVYAIDEANAINQQGYEASKPGFISVLVVRGFQSNRGPEQIYFREDSIYHF